MTTMIAEVYKALREAHVSEEAATAAAEAVANRNGRLERIENQLTDMNTRLAHVEGRLRGLTRVQYGVAIAIAVMFVRSFWPGTV